MLHKIRKGDIMMSFYLRLNKLFTISIAIVFLFSVKANAQTDNIQTNVPALKEVFKNDFTIGCMLSYAHIGFSSDPYVPGQSNIVAPNGGNLVKYHMNSMSPGNWMKSVNIVDTSGSALAYSTAITQEEKDSIDIHPIVRFNGNIIAQLNWAERQGFAFRGHTLVWHNQHPGTAFFRSGYTSEGTRLSKEKMTERLEHYIEEVIRIIHEGWPGLLTAMDVVNEAVNEDGSDRTSDSEWFQTFNDNTYVMKAFEFARKYTVVYDETQIKLYYNDYRNYIASKTDGIVRLCGPIYRAGYLDGIGMQEHDENSIPTAEQWITSYDKFDTICTEMSVTELYVNPGTTPDLTAQANQCAMLFKCFLDRSYKSGRGKIISVTKDGLNDEWAFVPNASFWDDQNQCKPAFYEVVDLAENYYALDSLVFYTDTLGESNYTPELWSEFYTKLTTANNALRNNYSASISAADALGNARNELETALDHLLGITTDIGKIDNNPERIILSQNYPNPFNTTTSFDITLPEKREIRIVVSDITGNVKCELINGSLNAGCHKISFDALQLPSGIYFCSLITDGFADVKKLVLIK